jgi:chromosome transmission fidelity protein 4
MLNDARIAGTQGGSLNATRTNHSPAFHATQHAKIVQNGNNSEASAMATPSPLARRSSASGSKKAEVEQPKDVEDNTAKVSPVVTPLAKIPMKNDSSNGKAKRDRDGAAGLSTVHQITKGGADQVGAKNKSSEDGNRAEPQRPLNPFAKSSSNKEQSSSLLDSIKKMKVESEKVDKANVKKVKV